MTQEFIGYVRHDFMPRYTPGGAENYLTIGGLIKQEPGGEYTRKIKVILEELPKPGMQVSSSEWY